MANTNAKMPRFRHNVNKSKGLILSSATRIVAFWAAFEPCVMVQHWAFLASLVSYFWLKLAPKCDQS